VPKNNWKKVEIDVDYNTAREVSRKRRDQDRRRDFDRREGPTRKNFGIDRNKEQKNYKDSKKSNRTEPTARNRPNRMDKERDDRNVNNNNNNYKKEREYEKIKGNDEVTSKKEAVHVEQEKDAPLTELSPQQDSNTTQEPNYWFVLKASKINEIGIGYSIFSKNN
jgi:hypothetical protein